MDSGLCEVLVAHVAHRPDVIGYNSDTILVAQPLLPLNGYDTNTETFSYITRC